ncbi:MAG: hypothetical protein ACLFS8_03535 [Clostridia bacterium]
MIDREATTAERLFALLGVIACGVLSGSAAVITLSTLSRYSPAASSSLVYVGVSLLCGVILGLGEGLGRLELRWAVLEVLGIKILLVALAQYWMLSVTGLSGAHDIFLAWTLRTLVMTVPLAILPGLVGVTLGSIISHR